MVGDLLKVQDVCEAALRTADLSAADPYVVAEPPLAVEPGLSA